MELKSILFILSISILFGCEKSVSSELIQLAEHSTIDQLVGSSVAQNSVSVWNGMISVPTIPDFIQLQKSLKELEESWNGEFQDDENNYVIPQEGLDAFESNLSFISLRKTIELNEEVFLSLGEPENQEDPDDFFIADDYLLSILNPNREIKIGQSIFILVEPNFAIEITDSDIATLESIRSDINDFGDVGKLNRDRYSSNVIIHIGNRSWRVASSSSSGPSVESCTVFAPKISFYWTTVPTNNLALKFTDNVANSMPHDVNAFGFDFRTAPLGQVPVSVFSGSGFMSEYIHTFPNNGLHAVCLTQTFEWYDALGGVHTCTKSFCDTVAVEQCCDDRDREKNKQFIYDNGQKRLKVFVWSKQYPFWGVYKLGAKTKSYRIRNNGNWKHEKADDIAAGIIGGTGGSVIFERGPLGDCNDPFEFTVANGIPASSLFTILVDKRTVTHNVNLNFEYFLHQNSVRSRNYASYNTNPQTLGDTTLRITQDCN